MKSILFFNAICLCFFISCKSIRDVRGKKCSIIIDSAKAFIQTENFAINVRPTIQDKSRNARLDLFLQKQTFNSLSCLLNHEDVALKFVGFQYAAFAYKDNLLKNYSKLLTDTTTVQLFYSQGKVSEAMKLGEILSIVMQKTDGNSEQ